eukprot:scaffold2923_cov313-Pinguiococcus_pyrenoidosus.AAC.2
MSYGAGSRATTSLATDRIIPSRSPPPPPLPSFDSVSITARKSSSVSFLSLVMLALSCSPNTSGPAESGSASMNSR